jgi:hypothetical protein
LLVNDNKIGYEYNSGGIEFIIAAGYEQHTRALFGCKQKNLAEKQGFFVYPLF